MKTKRNEHLSEKPLNDSQLKVLEKRTREQQSYADQFDFDKKMNFEENK